MRGRGDLAMRAVNTSIAPLRLFGQVVPGLFAVKSGDVETALVTRDGSGRVAEVLSVGDRHGGTAAEALGGDGIGGGDGGGRELERGR